jgi:hypothetical protein
VWEDYKALVLHYFEAKIIAAETRKEKGMNVFLHRKVIQ